MGQVAISILFFLLFCAIGIFGIIMSIDLCEYLKRYHSKKWKEISFERPFGIPQENFPIHPVKPVSLIAFLASSEDLDDTNILAYKKRFKLLFLAFVCVFIIFILFWIFF
jgi:hypothetical protein